MTRAEAVTYVKHLLFEDAATTAIGSTANINTTLNVANTTVWQRALQKAPSVFFQTSADQTYNATTGYFDISTLTPAPSLLGPVSIKTGNFYLPIEPVDANEKDKISLYTVTPQGVYPIAYWLDGSYLRLLPQPTGNQILRFSYPTRPIDLATDNDVLLGGKLVEFHALVCYEAVMALAAKDEASGVFASFKVLRDELRKDLDKHLSRRSTFRPHFIREIQFT